MTLHRYTPLKPSRGTLWPTVVKEAIFARDQGCVGPRVGMPFPCSGPLDPDHVRASGALGKKSRSTLDNGVILCRFVHHRLKTDNARIWRPVLIAWIDRFDHAAHVDPCGPDCRVTA